MNRDVHGGRSAARTLLNASDFALTEAVRDHDSAAHTEMIARHGSAMEALAEHVPGTDSARAFSEAFDRMHAVDNPYVPLRLAWLSEIAGTAEDLDQCGDAIWAAYGSLSAEWRTAIWHRYVEGDDDETLARLMGVDTVSAANTAIKARDALTLAVMARHTTGEEPECLRIRGFIEDNPTLGVRSALVLGDHARRCQDCRAMLLDLVRVEDRFEEVLAFHVLGGYAAAYLTAGPFRRREEAPVTVVETVVETRDAASVQSITSSGDRAAVVFAQRPALRLLAAGVAAAAVVGLVVSTQSTQELPLEASGASSLLSPAQVLDGEESATPATEASGRTTRARKRAQKRAQGRAQGRAQSTAPTAVSGAESSTDPASSEPSSPSAGDATGGLTAGGSSGGGPVNTGSGALPQATPADEVADAPAPSADPTDTPDEVEDSTGTSVSVVVKPPGGLLGPIEVEVPLALPLLG